MSALQVDVAYHPLKILKNVFKPVLRAATDTGIFARSSVPPTLADTPSLSAETQRHLQADSSPSKHPHMLSPPAQLPLNLPLRAQSKSSEFRNFFHLPDEEMLVGESDTLWLEMQAFVSCHVVHACNAYSPPCSTCSRAILPASCPPQTSFTVLYASGSCYR